LQRVANEPRGPPGPMIRTALRARRDPFGVLEDLAREYGDVVRLRLAGRSAYIVNDPELIRAILVDQAEAFPRGSVGPVTERLLGGSIVGSQGAKHHRKKAAAKPIVSHERLDDTLATATGLIGPATARWRTGETVDIAEAMSVLSIRVAAASIFSIRGEREAAELRRLLEGAMAAYELSLHPLGRLLDRVPTRAGRRARQSTLQLAELVGALVGERLRAPPAQRDALDILVAARLDPAGTEGLSPHDIRAIALDILIASHATIAHALAWTLYDMAGEPATQQRVSEEARNALVGGPLRLADLGHLRRARACFKEGLRLHPPVWAFVREAAAPVDLGGLRLPEGSLVVLSPRLTHRDARHFPDPARFDPERWAAHAPAPGGGITYFPFGAGPYGCLGDGLAMAQGTLVLALLLRSFSFERVGGAAPRENAAALQPEASVPLRVSRRPVVLPA